MNSALPPRAPDQGEHPPRSGAQLLEEEARRAHDQLADVQYGHTDGVIDLTWGHPDPSTFAPAAIAAATERVLSRRGWQTLTYGAPAGAAVVRCAIAEHLSSVDSPTGPDEVLLTPGSTGGLDLILTLHATPGDVVFVDCPTYFLALRIFTDHGVRAVALHRDLDGPDPDDLARRAAEVAASGHRSFLYLISTFGNPTGACLARARAEQLLAVAASHEVVVIDDDVYRDTTAGAPPSLFALDPEHVVRLGSFSKSLSPGMRVGYLTASAPTVARIEGCGVLDSGGGFNHFAAMIVGELVQSGEFATIVAGNQDRLRRRAAVMVDALDREVFRFTSPLGGFFVWLALPDGVSSAAGAQAALDHGVLVSNGDRCFVDPPDRGFIRLSFSMLDESLLREGAATLSTAIRSLLG